jgi:hypothetical protein
MLKTAGAAAGGGNPGLLPDEFIPDEWIKRNFFQCFTVFSFSGPSNQFKTHSKEGTRIVGKIKKKQT